MLHRGGAFVTGGTKTGSDSRTQKAQKLRRRRRKDQKYF
jgi:hypothetical protein